MKIAERFGDDHLQLEWTFSVLSKHEELIGDLGSLYFITRVHERVHESFQLLPPFPSTHRPLVVSAECFQTQK